MATDIDELRSRFKVPGLRFEKDSSGLIKAVVQTPAAAGELYLHGAHITHWQPADHAPVLWISRSSCFAADKPIRGGIPICFPWFGPHPSDSSLPAHGLARITEWQFAAAESEPHGSVRLTLTSVLPPFLLRLDASFGASLRITLETSLTQDSPEPATFEQALHTYLAIEDVRSVSISGLENASFVDKVDGAMVKPATGVPIEFSGETDRVYLNTVSDCLLNDCHGGREIRVRKFGSLSTVIWNPWIDKSIRMPDFGDDEWPEMVCIETANVGAAKVRILPGQSHSLTAEISLRTITGV